MSSLTTAAKVAELNERVLDNARNVKKCLSMIEQIAIQISQAIEGYKQFKIEKADCLDSVKQEALKRELQYGVIEEQLTGITNTAENVSLISDTYEETRESVVENANNIISINKDIKNLEDKIAKDLDNRLSTNGGTVYGDLTVTGLIEGRTTNSKLAEKAESVEWDGVLNKPVSFPPTEHEHDALYPSINGARAEGVWDISITGEADRAKSVKWKNITGRPAAITPDGIIAYKVGLDGGIENTLDFYSEIKSGKPHYVWGTNEDGSVHKYDSSELQAKISERAKADEDGKNIKENYVLKTDMELVRNSIGEVTKELEDSLKKTSVENETPDCKISFRYEEENGVLVIAPYVDGNKAYMTSNIIIPDDGTDDSSGGSSYTSQDPESGATNVITLRYEKNEDGSGVVVPYVDGVKANFNASRVEVADSLIKR